MARSSSPKTRSQKIVETIVDIIGSLFPRPVEPELIPIRVKQRPRQPLQG
jgi:hypothetical protein